MRLPRVGIYLSVMSFIYEHWSFMSGMTSWAELLLFALFSAHYDPANPGTRFSSLEPRRAAVSIVLRVRPAEGFPLPPEGTAVTLEHFFDQDWVTHPNSRAEILFIRRNKVHQQSRGGRGVSTEGVSNGSPAHVAFPGGRTEDNDEGALYTGTSYLRRIGSVANLYHLVPS